MGYSLAQKSPHDGTYMLAYVASLTQIKLGPLYWRRRLKSAICNVRRWY